MSTNSLDAKSVETINENMNQQIEMLTDEQVNALATKLNEKFNLPILNEKLEQTVFFKIVRLVDKKLYELLPNEYYGLINSANDGISADEAEHLENRLTDLLNSKINVPILSEKKEGELIKFIIGQIISAMIPGAKLAEKKLN